MKSPARRPLYASFPADDGWPGSAADLPPRVGGTSPPSFWQPAAFFPSFLIQELQDLQQVTTMSEHKAGAARGCKGAPTKGGGGNGAAAVGRGRNGAAAEADSGARFGRSGATVGGGVAAGYGPGGAADVGGVAAADASRPCAVASQPQSIVPLPVPRGFLIPRPPVRSHGSDRRPWYRLEDDMLVM